MIRKSTMRSATRNHRTGRTTPTGFLRVKGRITRCGCRRRWLSMIRTLIFRPEYRTVNSRCYLVAPYLHSGAGDPYGQPFFTICRLRWSVIRKQVSCRPRYARFMTCAKRRLPEPFAKKNIIPISHCPFRKLFTDGQNDVSFDACK